MENHNFIFFGMMLKKRLNQPAELKSLFYLKLIYEMLKNRANNLSDFSLN